MHSDWKAPSEPNLKQAAAVFAAGALIIVLSTLFGIAPIRQAGYRPVDYTVPVIAAQKPVGAVNINTATMEELQTLPGVGQKKAMAIITYRNLNGKFTSPQDLTKVSGISEAMVESWEDILLWE